MYIFVKDVCWVQDYEDVNDACRDFEFHYEEKSGNKWRNKNDFKKVISQPYHTQIGFTNICL